MHTPLPSVTSHHKMQSTKVYNASNTTSIILQVCNTHTKGSAPNYTSREKDFNSILLPKHKGEEEQIKRKQRKIAKQISGVLGFEPSTPWYTRHHLATAPAPLFRQKGGREQGNMSLLLLHRNNRKN